VEAIAIRGERVVAVGTSVEVRRLAAPRRASSMSAAALSRRFSTMLMIT
jgi:hypothetical protein